VCGARKRQRPNFSIEPTVSAHVERSVRVGVISGGPAAPRPCLLYPSKLT
jgi:hypothetical protein